MKLFFFLIILISTNLNWKTCLAESILDDLNKISPLLFDAFSSPPFTYHSVYNYFRLNNTLSNCLKRPFDSFKKHILKIIGNITEHKKNLQLAGEFIRDHLDSGSDSNPDENFIISFPPVNENLILEKKCRTSAFNCLKSVSEMAKQFLNNTSNKPVTFLEYRTTASLYLCWYTLNQDPLLSQFKSEKCSDETVTKKNQPNIYYEHLANNSKEFSCAKYSFCPDRCCGRAFFELNLIRRNFKETYESLKVRCMKSSFNPCSNESDGSCELSMSENKALNSLKLNQINVSCICPHGTRFNTHYSMCIDIDECQEQTHTCIGFKQTCLNTIGSFICMCQRGYRKLFNSEHNLEVCVLNSYYTDERINKSYEPNDLL